MTFRAWLPSALCLLCSPAWSQPEIPAAGGERRFDTGAISGVFRAGGRSRGLSPVVHLPSGLTLTQTKLSFGLLSFYRVFAGGRRFGPAAWDWPGEGRRNADGSLETHWPAAPGRPFDLRSVYRWSSPDTVDLEAVVAARDELPDFEVFVASYFAAQFTPSFVHAERNGKAAFVPAGDADGDWQIFPRDAAALRLIRSGRWNLPPNPIEWAVRPNFATPVAYRRDPASGTTAILMADPEDCIAIASPKAVDIHYSTYFSLFGRTLKAGESATARMRLVVARAPSEARILDLYRLFREERGRR